jgi:NAD(P)-dependent dehydrogenase (short-subunit alcohol dehydrogenase family)
VEICRGRIVIVTGAGRGLGREHALEFARQGAKVVVNDIGVNVDGNERSNEPANEVADLIRASGGEAITNGEDISEWDGARRLIEATVKTFGGFDVLVNNAGILRDRMIVNMNEQEWDAVIKVHLKGTFAPVHWAADYWRTRSKSGESNKARIINTSSPSGIYGNIGQANYGAAKAGIAAFTMIAAMELERYGVTVNAISPSARTRMTENIAGSPSSRTPKENAFDSAAPENIAPLVAWLGSEHSDGVTGRVFNVVGGVISVAEAWHAGPSADKGERWDPAELSDVVPGMVGRAQRNPNMLGEV